MNLLTLLVKQRVSQKVHSRPPCCANSRGLFHYTHRAYRKGNPARFPAQRGQAEKSIKKPCCNYLLQQGLYYRGERIRTSDLLNPIQAR
jgi:hypothetical protein